MVDCIAKGQPPYNCEGCDLSGQILSGLDLTNAVLKGAILTGASFKGVTSLAGADLTGAVIGDGTDFTECDLSTTIFGPNPNFGSNALKPTRFVRATLPLFSLARLTWTCLDLTEARATDLPKELIALEVSQSNLTRFDFSNKTLTRVHFDTVVLVGADFTNSILNHIVFTQDENASMDLTGAKFCSAHIPFGVFDKTILTSADFTNAISLNPCTFLDARMDGTKFDGVDLTACTFSPSPRWSKDPASLTSFKGATLKLSVIGKNWSFLVLTDAKLVGLDNKVDLTWLQGTYANLSGMDLSGYTLDKCDLTGAMLSGTKFQKARMGQAILQGTQGDKPIFDGAILTGASFAPSIGSHGSPSRLLGASFSEADLTGADLTAAVFSPAVGDSGKHDQIASFNFAKMNDVTAPRADFTGATFTGGVVMHRCNFASATLAGADMTSCQLGAISDLFSIPADATDFPVFKLDLDTQSRSGVVKIFEDRGYPKLLHVETVAVSVVAAGYLWKITSDGTSYTVMVRTSPDGKTELAVLSTTVAANLSNAFMPNAILNNANLWGVDADGIQLFSTGDQAQLVGALMDEINLTGAILGGNGVTDLTGASLNNATLSRAFLVNVKFNKAQLAGARLDGAQLQGADLTDAILGGAHLNNAAISVDASNDTAGVFLFQGEAHDCAAAMADLKIAADAGQIELASSVTQTKYDRLIAVLRPGIIDPILSKAFQQEGVTVSANAIIRSIASNVWEVADPTPTYNIWKTWTVDEKTTVEVLAAAPTVPALASFFLTALQIKLSPRLTVQVGEDDKSWIIDNDSDNPENLDTGYVKFLVKQNDDGSVAVYGTFLHSIRGADIDNLTIEPVAFHATVLTKSTPNVDPAADTFLSGNTICPNEVSLSNNVGAAAQPYFLDAMTPQQALAAWHEMLRARPLPKPPTRGPSMTAPS
ncbi:MAG: hypothetical protein QOD12_2975 [Verrucomicrobiota bacterium]|jgi:uncharacterized protein YjbI with pentapeptide repeats